MKTKDLFDLVLKSTKNKKDTFLFLTEYLKIDKNDILLNKEVEIPNINKELKLLENDYPIQYLIGNVNFYGYLYKITEDVLIPRFETEELVFKTINYINKYFINKKIKVLDLCTGSGVIGITLKKEIPSLDVTISDISKEALKVAKSNIDKKDINVVEGNLLEPLKKTKFSVIISNPPYIDRDEEIMDKVKKYEPHLALYALNKGLYYYEEILKQVKNNLEKQYLIAFEIGCKQALMIKELGEKYLSPCKITIEKDLGEKNRFIFITNID